VAAVVVGLGPLVRPDLALASAAFLLALAWALRPPPGRAVLLLVAAAAAPVGYQVFRMGYYGLLVPMPALGKEAREPRWERGLLYLADLVAPYALWLPLLLLLPLALVLVLVLVRSPEPGWRRRWVPVLLAPVAAGTGLGLYVARVGGDFMHGRLLLPALLALLLPVLVAPVRRATVPVAAGVATWALVCAAVLRVPYADGFSPTGIADERGHYTTVVEDPHPITAAPHAAHLLERRPAVQAAIDAEPPLLVYAEPVDAERVEDRWDFRTLPLGTDASVAGVWTVLGVTGAVVPLDGLAVDPNGLAYTVSGHLELNRPGRAGHEKWLPNSWAVADHAVPGSVLMPPTSIEDVGAARRALGCGELRELLDSAREPMSWGRFWDNLVGAPARTTLRIPADPHAAERLFCGGGE
jgi:arabinofuranosyltransferase